MRSLILLRHAKSSWKDLSLPDHERPLNKRGELAAPLMGQRLAQKEIQPQLVMCSSAIRASTTAEKTLAQISHKYEIQFLTKLYHAYPDEIIHMISKASDIYKTILLVGHTPGLTQLANDLMGEYYFSNIPTAGMVTLSLSIDSWKSIINLSKPAKLLDYDYPKK